MLVTFLSAAAYLGYSQFIAKNVSDYTTLMTNYKAKTSNSELWNYANMVNGYGLLAVYSIALVF